MNAKNDLNNGNREQEAETFPLDEALIGVLKEIQQQMQILIAHQQGALQLFARQHELQGEWQVAENGRELVKK